VLLTVVLGTLTANCMNLYSGAMAALVVKFPTNTLRAPVVIGALFALLSAAIELMSHVSAVSAQSPHLPFGTVVGRSLHMMSAVEIGFAIAVGVIVGLVGHVRIARWKAAVVVGVLGAILAFGGGHPEETAKLYTNFLLLLSYWASPWAAVVFVDWLHRRGQQVDPKLFESGRRISPGLYAWIIGLAASLPFWNQAWYTGPFAQAFPQFGDLSYYVGFIVAAIIMLIFSPKYAARRTRS